MSRFDELISRYAPAPSQQDFYDIGAARQNQTGFSMEGELQQDLRTLTQSQLLLKYGANAGSDLIAQRAIGASAYNADRQTLRTGMEGADDSLASVGLGVTNSIGGLAALGLGLVNEDLGVGAAKNLQKFNEDARSGFSEGFQNRQRAAEVLNRLNTDDNRYTQEQEEANGANPLFSSLRRIGRDIVDTGAATLDDPYILGDATTQGVGSLLAGGGISKGLGVTGNAIKAAVGPGRAAAVAVAAPKTFDALARGAQIAGRARMTAAIAGMEAGGAYTGTVQQIMLMSDDELYRESDQFRELIAQNFTPDEARTRMANRGGQVAAAIQAPIGALTGALVAKFEGAPLSVGSFKGALSNVGRETIEEGVQSASGQLAQNMGVRVSGANPDFDLADGIGEQTAMGALAGSLTAGVVQAPGVGLRAAVETAKLPLRGAQAVINSVNAKGERIMEDVAAASPVAPAAMDQAYEATVQSAPEVDAGFRASVETLDIAPEVKVQANQYLDSLNSRVQITEDEIAQQFPVIAEALNGTTDRFDAIRRVSAIAADEAATSNDRVSAGLFLLDQLESADGLRMREDLISAIEAMDDADPALQQLQDYESVILGISQDSRVIQAVQAAMSVMSQMNEEQVSEDKIGTPDGDQAVSNAIGLAQHEPMLTNPRINDVILSHAAKGLIILTPAQKMAVQAAQVLKQTEELQAQIAERLNMSDTLTNRVSAQIVSDLSGDERTNTYTSAAEHVTKTLKAMRAGRTDIAEQQLKSFAEFARSMQNKLTAMNESFTDPNSTNEATGKYYQTVDPNNNNRWFRSDVAMYVDGAKASSVNFAKKVAQDAEITGTLVNNLIRILPDLDVVPVAMAQLDAGLVPVTKDVVSAARTAGRASAKVQPAQTTNAPTAPAAPTPDAIVAEPVQVQPTTEVVEDEVDQPIREQQVEEPVQETVVEETPVEPVREEQEIPEEAEVQAFFPDLIGKADTKVTDWFRKSFKAPAQPKSNLYGSTTPLAYVREQMTSTREAPLGVQALAKSIESEYGKMLDMAGKLGKGLMSRMSAYLNEPAYKNGPKNGEVLLREMDGETVMTDNAARPHERVRAKSLNILEVKNGKFKVNQELLEGAALAATQWLITMDQIGSRMMDDETLAEMLKIDITDITPEIRSFFAEGQTQSDAFRSLGSKILDYWGVVPNANVEDGMVKGIAEAVAQEMLTGLIDQGQITRDTMTFTNTDEDGLETPKDFVKFNRTKSEEIDKQNELLAYAPQAIDEVALVEPAVINHIGVAPKGTAQFQMRNKLVPLTASDKKAIEFYQNIPHTPDTYMYDLYEAMGDNALLALMAEGELGNRKLNKNDLASKEGKNLSYTAAMKQIRSVISEMKAYSEANSVELREVPIFYEYGMSKVNRLQQMGLYGPQASKLAREVFMPNKSTLDLTDPTQLAVFKLAVAQAWGEKVHKISRTESGSRVDNAISGSKAEALTLLRDWLESGSDLTDANVQTLKTAGLNTPVALHAALEVARWQMAGESERKSFESSLYVEADGVTDGPINTLVLMAAGPFTEKWVNLVGKGGLFFGERMTMNDYSDKDDLYAEAVTALTEAKAGLRSKLKGQSVVLSQMDALDRMMDLLLKGASFSKLSDGKPVLEFGRDVVKNPLTVTIYGSGEAGIANKIMGEMKAKLYEVFSSMAENESPTAYFLDNGLAETEADAQRLYDQFAADMAALTKKAVRKQNETYSLIDLSSQTAQPSKKDAENYTFTSAQMKNLQENILNLFVQPMREGVGSVIGETTTATKALQSAVQVQSIFMQHAFQREYRRMVDEKIAKDSRYSESMGLSQKELNTLYERLGQLSPFISTGFQNLMPSSSDRTEVTSTPWARSLDDKMASNVQYFGPTDAGVKGIPFTVISGGDARMVQLIGLEQIDGILPVFDGIHLKLDTLDVDAERVNKTVRQMWSENPLAAVSETYSSFLSDVNLDQLSDSQLTDVAQSFFTKKEIQQIGRENLKSAVVKAMQTLDSNLSNLSVEIQARHEVMAMVNTSTDHMAGAASPYVQDGKVNLEGLSADQKANVLNTLLEQRLKDLNDKPETQQEISEELSVLGDSHSSGARVISTTELPQLVRDLNLSKDQRSVLMPMLRALEQRQFKIVVGTAEQTAAYTDSYGLPPIDPSNRGTITFGNQTIYLHEGTIETMLHELIHAATYEKVDAYFNEVEILSKEDREAVERLDGLMDEWLNDSNTLAELNADIRQDYFDAKTVVQSLLLTNRAAALNEFMAWSLSNQNIAKVQSRIKVKNPVLRVLGDALKALKVLIFGSSRVPYVSDDLWTNIRFNAQILTVTPITVARAMGEVTLHQSASFGTSQRLTDLRERMQQKIADKLNAAPIQDKTNLQSKINVAISKGILVRKSFQAHGFPMTMQEASTFDNVVAAFIADVEMNPNSLLELNKLYDHVSKTVTVEDLMVDPNSTDPNDRFIAQEQFNSIMGDFGTEFDDQGRSTLLPAFLALANTNDHFRSVLAKIEMPKTKKKTTGAFLDRHMTNFGNASMDRVAEVMAGANRNAKDVSLAVDALTRAMAKSAEEQNDFITQVGNKSSSVVDAANDWVVDNLHTWSDNAFVKLEDLRQNSSNKLVKEAAAVGQLAVGVVNRDRASDLAMGIMSNLNSRKVWKPLHEIINEMVARTPSNATVYDLIKAVKTSVQQTRQNYRETLPEIIAEKFSRELTDAEWTGLFKTFAKTDLAVLSNGFSMKEILDMIKDEKVLDAQIARVEARINLNEGARAAAILRATGSLATLMNYGEVSSNVQYRNATAAAGLWGTKQSQSSPDALTVKDVDQLATMYALKRQDKKDVVPLVDDQAEGLEFALYYLLGQRSDELAKLTTGKAKANAYKGYVPSEKQEGAAMFVASDSDFAELTNRGFKRVADFKGSNADISVGSKGYYYSPVSGRSAYLQGIMQNVKTTANGIDPNTGFTQGHLLTAGVIADQQTVAQIKRRLANNTGKEPLMPIFDDTGEIIAFERSTDRFQTNRLKKNTHLGQMIGAWRGRQVEEAMATQFNLQLIDSLKAMYDKDLKEGKAREYVDLFSKAEQKADPVLMDAVNIFTPETKLQIKAAFGDSTFMVRRDMINDSIGYRSASIGDNWTGVSRMSDTTQKSIQRVMMGLFGSDAYTKLVSAEKIYQNVVSSARVLIVVKSVIVPMANLMSNIMQMSARGIPLTDTLKKLPAKAAETDTYLRNHKRKVQIEAELRAAKDATVVLRLNTELKAIEDANKRMSIWPVIQELSSITDGGITREELAFTEGRLTDYMESLVDRLPKGIRDAGRYAWISRDTALFQGMNRVIQYGDFLAKSISYDHLTQKGMDPVEALANVNERFVNYDRLPGRARSKLESLGLLWFWNFKLRSVKEALGMIRDNPVHTLLASIAQAPEMFGTVGLPTTDNIFSVAADGRLTNSMGIGQGLRSWTLHPWVQIVS